MTTYHKTWDDYAEEFQAYLEETVCVEETQIFPRIITVLGEVKGKRVLDIGCGQGRFSRAFHDLGAEVTAYDISPKELEIAVSLDAGRGIRYVSDKAALKTRNAYDLILCFMALLCNPRKEALQLVQASYDSLVPGGFACFVNTYTETLGQQFKDFFSPPPIERKQGAPYTTIVPTSKGDIVVNDYYYSPEHLKEFFRSAHFEVDHEEIILQQYVFHKLKKSLCHENERK